jgi:diguanylate cyclase (GGDEF)-like protein
MRQLAETDQLTGIANRRTGQACLDSLSRMDKANYAVGIIDIDDFKAVNDTYGHDCGDAVLKEITAELQAGLRQNDLLCRWGGEEFLLILSSTNVTRAEEVVNRLRERVASREIKHDGVSVSVTFTAGLAERQPGQTATDTLKRADSLLYYGKRIGKNRVVSAYGQ